MDKAKARLMAGELAFKDGPGLAAPIRRAHARRYFRELSRSWDLWYELFFHNDPPGMTRRRYEEITEREAARLLGWITPSSAFLDLGCGAGRILRRVAPHCARAHGADISAKALGHAKRACRGLANVRFSRVRGLELPFEDAGLDLVFCHLMLSHLDVEAVVAYLKEIRRVLKPGGRLVFDLPNLLDPGHLRYLLASEGTNWPGINRPHFWTAEMARAIVAGCGFALEALEPGIFLDVRARVI